MKQVLLCLFCLFFFIACGTKRQYFQPSQVDGVLKHSKNLQAKIVDWNLVSAKLSNGKALVKDGIIDELKLEKNFILLNYQNGELILADNDGNLKIVDSFSNEVYSSNFSAAVLSVAVDGDDLALVLADNSIVLVNRNSGIQFSRTLAQAVGQDNRMASPLFLDNIIVYPTLDGKLVIISRVDFKIVKDVIVSAESFFNNIIHLSAINDTLIVATAKKIIVVNPLKTFYLETDIKDVLVAPDSIFILQKDGVIIKTDLDLQKIAQQKFEFALFTKASIFQSHLYVLEKTGYLIKTDFNLQNIQIFKLQDAVDKMSFMGNGALYYGEKILDLL
ncbi:hypothetical protein OQH60_00960 [Campylobacter sp. MIT 21-1685]|uniref:hypothetical protein n=1 Tax=unclassified Campylobacter TaxID=2593542 RepID=UPI00224B4520|nr:MULTISPECIES: hypothetical protein [unclassified Campylobacter]MCX2682449.1 hypothetical protein [Campylobacter sp. MIT 21-1684]MCX2750838.1 hypothetical protein [Campylobacter sp. MIT 21-1682]MCX2806930.1 hypothetical protein [Campylobacter sp. MIT 21-1685]